MFPMIKDEVRECHYVAGRDDALVFGGEYASVFKGLHKSVDVVDLIDLGAREVEDDSLLVVVRVGDIGDFAISHYKGSIGRGEIAGHSVLPRVPGFVEVPEDLTWVNGSA